MTGRASAPYRSGHGVFCDSGLAVLWERVWRAALEPARLFCDELIRRHAGHLENGFFLAAGHRGSAALLDPSPDRAQVGPGSPPQLPRRRGYTAGT